MSQQTEQAKRQNMPLISVVIPVYNGEKTIAETIESVLNQSFSNFEIVVINDGSQDSTLDVIASIQDPRIKIFSYPNAGLSASRNRGISQSSGEFIAFLDADDLWTPDKLEAQLTALQENPNAAVAYSWTDFIDETSQFLKPGPHFTISGDVYAELLRGNFLANGSNPLIRRQALIKVGSFDVSFSGVADWELYLRLATHYHFVAVPSPQILYRLSANSMSTNLFKQEADSIQFIEQAYAQAPESLQHLKKECFGFLYQYLIYKALEGSPGRQKGLKAAKLLWNYIKNAPSRHRLLRLKFSLLLKIMVAILLPHRRLQLDR